MMYQTPPPGYPVASAGPCGQNPSPAGTAEKRVLYVGNLSPECTEQMLVAVFAQFGECHACKIIRAGGGSDNYAFLELGSHQQAQVALTAMNRITLMGRELRVNWATAPGTKPDPARGHHVFIGDLVTDIEESEITDMFVPFGPILEVRIVRHSDGGQKTYAFLTYENEEDAKTAIETMNGNLLRFKPMRVSWATRRNGGSFVSNRNQDRGGADQGGASVGVGGIGSGGDKRRGQKRSYEEVYNESTLYNTSVYFGGIQSGLNDALVREHFAQFGSILDVKVYADKGFAFVRFDSHDSAAKAIVAMHGVPIGGFVAKLGWGREPGTTTGAATGGPGGPPPAKSAPPAQPPPNDPAGGFSTPAPGDPSYQKYYSEYMEWYNKYGHAYYAQQQQPQPQGAANGSFAAGRRV